MGELCNRIKQLRKSNKITQAQLAEHLQISVVNLQRFEYGKRRPSVDTLLALANYFNVSIDYLLGRTDNPEINNNLEDTKIESKSNDSFTKLLAEKNSEEISKTVSLLLKLDDFDKGKITERIKVFLESDKYLKDNI